jgi:2-methylaconitate cis-trans-isomerase PrpF
VASVPGGRARRVLVEHPTGASPVLLTVEERDGRDEVTEGAIISTARALFTGQVLVPEQVIVAR